MKTIKGKKIPKVTLNKSIVGFDADGKMLFRNTLATDAYLVNKASVIPSAKAYNRKPKYKRDFE
jgi:hypothetical protein